MGVLRHRLALRLAAGSALLVAAAAAFQVWRGATPAYVPGERAEGLVDSLGRRLPDDRPALAFVDVAREAGLVFRHFPAVRAGRLPEDMGSGAALGDFDGDGWTDAFLVNAGGPSRLFRNRGDGRFEDVTTASGIDLDGLGMGAAFCDVDSDGDLDLFATAFGRCRLWRNEGQGRFRDVSREAGVDGPEGFWTGVAVGDYDRDGAVDLYVCGYVRYREAEVAGRRASQYGIDIPVLLNPSSFEPERNLLFRGRGDGTFEEVAQALRVDNLTGRSLSAVMCDLTGDHWPDLYVANDVSDNALFVNRGDGTFEDATHESLLGDYRGAMGLAVADADGDGDQDVFITHWIAQENALYLCYPRAGRTPIFRDEADRHGLGQIALDKVGWATGFVDFDNDGRLDLFAVNGSTIPVPEEPVRLAPMRTQLFWNAGGKRGYFEIGGACGDFFRAAHVGRGGAAFDYDLDGDEDLLVVLHGEEAALLRNDGGNRGRSIRLRLRQPTGNRFALGSAVVVSAGETVAHAITDTQGSYLSQHAAGEIAFGLGSSAEVLSVEVTWPDGATDSAGPFPADALVTWERGGAPRVEPLPGKAGAAARGPADLESKKRFYALREEAGTARIAGDLARAADLYRQALRVWPDHEDCLYYLGNCARELGDEREALRQFERLVAADPGSNGGWMQIGMLRLPGGDSALDDPDLAEKAFRRCHAINGEESRPVVQLGIVALLRGDLDAAGKLFADAAVLNHRSVEARWMAGRVAWLRGDRERARAWLAEARAIAVDPQTPAPLAGEGDTRSGSALTAREAGTPHAFLDRWRTLARRELDVDAEYRDGSGAERPR